MQLVPPPDSKISVTMDGLDELISIPQPTSYSRYFVGPFLLVMLGAWAFGFYNVAPRVSSGASTFVIFWLGGWIVGGLGVASFLFRVIRPAIPETLRLRAETFLYDSGMPPYQGSLYQNPTWNQVFPKRNRIEVSRQQLVSLRLRDTESGNRLTVDVDSRRIELGQAASEIEREWLFRMLTERYGIKRGSR